MATSDRNIFKHMSSQAWANVAAGRKRLLVPLRAQVRVFAEEVASGKSAQETLHVLEPIWERRLREVKRPWLMALAVRGYNLAGLYMGQKSMLSRFGAKALGRVKIELEGNDELISNHLKARVGDWIEQTSKYETSTSAQRLEAIYQAALTKGDGLTQRQIADRILEEGLAQADARAEMMSRVMSIWGVNEGANELYRREGVEAKEWMTTEDELLCEECAEMDGKTVGIDGLFAEGEENGIDVEHPPLHPNCRCVLLPVIDAKSI